MKSRHRIVFSGYLVRCPLGGYAWQVAHYLLGLQALGHEVWFWEDTALHAPAYDPARRTLTSDYAYGLAAAGRFFEGIGLGDRWVFFDAAAGVARGPARGRAETVLRDADLVIDFAGVNAVPAELRGRRNSIFIDADPGFTQLKLAAGDAGLRARFHGTPHLFTFGENIGTERSSAPTGGHAWRPTRQPVVLERWTVSGVPGPDFSTVGTWEAQGRDLVYRGERYGWNKRTQWLRFMDLPDRTGQRFEMAVRVPPKSTDGELLARHGWKVVDPIPVSSDPWRYRDYVRNSRGEFSAAKDMNVRLRTGWFSDRSACYLAAGRPVVLQDTGFGDVLPLGPGLHAVRTLEEAAEAIREIEADYSRASAHAAEVAREYFAAERVLGSLLEQVGL